VLSVSAHAYQTLTFPNTQQALVYSLKEHIS